MRNRISQILIGALLMAATSAVGITLAGHQPASGSPLPRAVVETSTTTTTAAPAATATTTTQKPVVRLILPRRGAPHPTITTRAVPVRTACQGGTNGVC